MSIEVSLSKELELNLDNLPKEIAQKIKRAVILNALTRIERQAKRNVRVDTGRLRSSIHTKYDNVKKTYTYKVETTERNKSEAPAGTFDGTLNEQVSNGIYKFDVIVGSNVEYATKIENLDPYLYPAFKRAMPYLKKDIEKILKEAGK